jgi:hypothetical protein
VLCYDRNGLAARQFDGRTVGNVEWLVDDDFVARIEDGAHGKVDGLARATVIRTLSIDS